MPSDLTLKAMNLVHRTMLALSRGRRGWTVLDMPVLELTTVGRRTGRPRSVMLTSPWQDGATLVVVASRGGDDRPPAWLLNTQAEPRVTVTLRGGTPQAMTARTATAEERARLWPLLTAEHTNYADYQERTTREIALVLLEPGT